MGKIRVLQIITRLSPGGASRFVISLCDYLAKEEFEIFLLTGRPHPFDRRLFKQLEKRHIPYQIIPDLSRNINPLNDPKAFFKLCKIIKKFKPHILHTHTSKAGVLGRWAGKINRVPIIIHQGHGLALAGQWRTLEVSRFATMVKFFIWLEKISAPISDCLITYTKGDIEEHLRLGIGRKEQFLVLYYGIDLEEFHKKEIDRKSLGLNSEDYIVGTAGRLVPQKGLEYLIEAAKIVHGPQSTPRNSENFRDKVPEISRKFQGVVHTLTGTNRTIKFLIIGDGHLRKSLEEKTKKLGLQDSIIFLGWREDIPDLLNVMDIYIQPSLYESFGIALSEAQACGLPVIATKAGSFPELIKDRETGLLIRPKDSSAIISAINLLISNPSLAQKLAQAGGDYVRKNYALDKVMQKFKTLYLKNLHLVGVTP